MKINNTLWNGLMRATLPANSFRIMFWFLCKGHGSDRIPAPTIRKISAEIGIPIASVHDAIGKLLSSGVLIKTPAREYVLDASKLEALRQITFKKKPIPPALRAAVFARDGYKCKKCGCTTGLHCDHIIPESKGGMAIMSNLQTLCAFHNKSKGNRIL